MSDPHRDFSNRNVEGRAGILPVISTGQTQARETQAILSA